MEDKENWKMKDDHDYGKFFGHCDGRHFCGHKAAKILIVVAILLLVLRVGIKIGEYRYGWSGFYGYGHPMMNMMRGYYGNGYGYPMMGWGNNYYPYQSTTTLPVQQ